MGYKQPEDIKTIVCSFRLTPRRKEELTKLAKAKGFKSLSGFISAAIDNLEKQLTE